MRLLFFYFVIFFLQSCLPNNAAEQRNAVVQESGLSIDDVLFDQSAEMLGSVWLLRSGQDFLSVKAQDNLKKMMQKHSSLRQHMMTICGLEPTLSEDDKAKIGAIKSDATIQNDDKKAQIKSLLDDRMRDSSRAISTCRTNKKEQLRPFVNEKIDMKAACLITFKSDEQLAGNPTKKARAWQRVKTLTPREKHELNRRLESRACEGSLI